MDRYNNDNNGHMEKNGELRLIQEVLPSASVVFDIGANIGDWTMSALKINSRAEYHCFEPNPATFRLLLAQNFPSNAILNNLGIGEKVGSMELYVSEGNSGNDSLYNRQTGNAFPASREIVRIDTLDAYCERRGIRHIDFLKVDVEGHELSVLRSGKKLLEQGTIKMIQFEYGGTYIDAGIRLKDVWDFMQATNKNYALCKVHPGELRPIPAYHQSLENYQYSNWVLMK